MPAVSICVVHVAVEVRLGETPWVTLTLVQSERAVAPLSNVTVPEGAGLGVTPVKVAVNKTPWFTLEAGVGDGTSTKLPKGGSDCRLGSTVNSVPGVEEPMLPLAVARLACLRFAPPIAVNPPGPVPTASADAVCRVPSPRPYSTLTVESVKLAVATSALPSPLKSATTSGPGWFPTA